MPERLRHLLRTATLTAALATSIWLTMSRSLRDLPTIAFHLPVLFIAAGVAAYAVPPRWWPRLYPSIVALIVAELLLINAPGAEPGWTCLR